MEVWWWSARSWAAKGGGHGPGGDTVRVGGKGLGFLGFFLRVGDG